MPYSDVKHAVNYRVVALDVKTLEVKAPLCDATLLEPDRLQISIGNSDYVFLTRLHLNCQAITGFLPGHIKASGVTKDKVGKNQRIMCALN